MASFMFLKKCCFLFLLISASFSSTSSAVTEVVRWSEFTPVERCNDGRFSSGRQLRSVNLEKEAMASTYKGHQQLHQGEETNIIHGRLLRVNTKDYGNYDPAPTFVKPPFKLIPN